MKIIKKERINNIKIVSILGLPVFSYGYIEYGQTIEKFFELFPHSAEEQVYEIILKQIPNNHDLIIYARTGIGETYLLNLMLDGIIEKYKAKSPCIICHKKQYGDICKLLNPNIPFYYVELNSREIFPVLTHREKHYKGHIFNINPSTLKELQNFLASIEANSENKKQYIEIIQDFNKILQLNR